MPGRARLSLWRGGSHLRWRGEQGLLPLQQGLEALRSLHLALQEQAVQLGRLLLHADQGVQARLRGADRLGELRCGQARLWTGHRLIHGNARGWVWWKLAGRSLWLGATIGAAQATVSRGFLRFWPSSNASSAPASQRVKSIAWPRAAS